MEIELKNLPGAPSFELLGKIADVAGVTEATSTEVLYLWQEFHGLIDSWQQITTGHTIILGYLGKRPINLDLRFAMLNGRKVCFYYPVSEVVDWQIINEWVNHFLRSKDQPRSDAMNFANLLRDLNIKIKPR